VRQPDPVAADRHHRRLRKPQPAQSIVIAAHRHHRRHLRQVVQHRRDAEVAGVEDQVAAVQRLQHRGGQRVQELADVGVGDHADPAGRAQQR
jgi:hypothetical protein